MIHVKCGKLDEKCGYREEGDYCSHRVTADRWKCTYQVTERGGDTASPAELVGTLDQNPAKKAQATGPGSAKEKLPRCSEAAKTCRHRGWSPEGPTCHSTDECPYDRREEDDPAPEPSPASRMLYRVDGGHTPTVRHSSRLKAEREACRLAKVKGGKYAILEATGFVEAVPVKTMPQ